MPSRTQTASLIVIVLATAAMFAAVMWPADPAIRAWNCFAPLLVLIVWAARLRNGNYTQRLFSTGFVAGLLLLALYVNFGWWLKGAADPGRTDRAEIEVSVYIYPAFELFVGLVLGLVLWIAGRLGLFSRAA